jgi:D-xylose 1-dehydrogenase (NADP+, D-xylono-1,5-lactone-forming)
MMKTRFGIVGTSGHASRVAAPVLKRNPEVSLLGAAGSARERSAQFAQQHGLPRTYGDLDEMLRDRDIDAVWICSPNHLHAGQVAQCASAGKHALVEKPLATSLVDAQAAVRAAEAAGVILRVGCQHRFRPAHQHLRQLIQSGFVGRLGFFRIHRFWRYPYFPDMDPAGPPQWRRSGEQSGGWVINDIGSHLLDLMLWISNLNGTVMGAALAAQQFKLATEDSTAVLVRLGESAIGIMETSCANDSPGSRIEIYGGSGWIRADDTLSGASTVTSHEGQTLTFPPLQMLDTYSAEVADFRAAVQGKPSIGADGGAGAQLVGIIEAAVGAGSRG